MPRVETENTNPVFNNLVSYSLMVEWDSEVGSSLLFVSSWVAYRSLRFLHLLNSCDRLEDNFSLTGNSTYAKLQMETSDIRQSVTWPHKISFIFSFFVEWVAAQLLGLYLLVIKTPNISNSDNITEDPLDFVCVCGGEGFIVPRTICSYGLNKEWLEMLIWWSNTWNHP